MPVALVEDGVEVFDDPRSAATGCTVLVTMMSEASAVLDSAPPALAALERSAIWLQTSTIGVEGTELCAELADRHGVQFVDAPVLGTRKPAQDGELVILGSGPDEALDSCEALVRRARIADAAAWPGRRGHPLQAGGEQLDRGVDGGARRRRSHSPKRSRSSRGGSSRRSTAGRSTCHTRA